MGMVFGKSGVAEPVFTLLHERAGENIPVPYEVRQYGERFAIEAAYDDNNDDNSPFRLLARYIGVFGTPQNQQSKPIAMTAPVATSATPSDGRRMQFVLPAEFDDLSKIPPPTDERVKVVQVAPAVGVVHRFNGSYDSLRGKELAKSLATQLTADGVAISEQEALDRYQFWGYNPPFTIPYLRRNEIWIELTSAQAEALKEKTLQ